MLRVYFLDSIAVVKRYVHEAGSEWIRALCHDSRARLVVASLTGAETASAIRQKARLGDLDRPDEDWALAEFGKHFGREYTRIHLHLRIIHQAVHLLALHPLKASDAIQLASALAAKKARAVGRAGFRFVAADRPLLGAAKRAELMTENPHDYS